MLPLKVGFTVEELFGRRSARKDKAGLEASCRECPISLTFGQETWLGKVAARG